MPKPKDVKALLRKVDLRNRAFAYLKIAVCGVCEHGQFAFRSDPEHRKLYTNDYRRKVRALAKSAGRSRRAHTGPRRDAEVRGRGAPKGDEGASARSG